MTARSARLRSMCAHAASRALAHGVGVQAVAQPGAGARAPGDQPCHRQASRAPSAHGDGQGDPAPAPGASFGRPPDQARLVLEADAAPADRPGSFTSAQVASFQAVTACPSRSATPRAGICAVKPSRRINLVAPGTR
jgi:hypothetical protein